MIPDANIVSKKNDMVIQMTVLIIASVLFMIVNVAVYSLYSKFVLGEPILFNDVFHYSLIVIISTVISFMSMHVMGMRL